MRFVKSSPSEFLVVGRRGRIVNRGTAASAFVWPGSTWVTVSATRQEARFEMTQETRDGIPLRFKGIVVYRVVDPVAAATLFDFSGDGHAAIQALLAHICLGELRATAAHLTMAQCIEQRKTTLTDAVRAALEPLVRESNGWGLGLDVVQVAQVFIVDEELRRRLEAGVRNELASRSSRSEIQMKEEIRLAQLASERRLQDEALATERRRAEVDQEKQRLAQAVQQAALEAETPVRLLRLEKEREVARLELEVRRVANEAKALEVEGATLAERAQLALRKELLPLEQAPAIAQALAGIFDGAHLTLYGKELEALAPLSAALELLVARLRPVLAAPGDGGYRPAPEPPAAQGCLTGGGSR